MKADKIDQKILAYSFLQFKHSKGLRDKHRIKLTALHLLCSLFYSEHYLEPPERGGVKTRLHKMNPQINYATLNKHLDTLYRGGLIEKTPPNKLQSYSIHITGEGEQLINELFSIHSIGELLNRE